MSNETIIHKWEKAAKVLVGKTIKSVRYMSDEEQESAGLNSKPLIIEFTDDTYIYPSSDEGNDAGAIFGGSYTDKKIDLTFPVI